MYKNTHHVRIFVGKLLNGIKINVSNCNNSFRIFNDYNHTQKFISAYYYFTAYMALVYLWGDFTF